MAPHADPFRPFEDNDTDSSGSQVLTMPQVSLVFNSFKEVLEDFRGFGAKNCCEIGNSVEAPEEGMLDLQGVLGLPAQGYHPEQREGPEDLVIR